MNEVVAVLLLAEKFGLPVCPHAGGNFSDGTITGTKAYCPLHNAEVDVRTGMCGPPCTSDVDTYDVSCDSTDLFLHVD